MTNPTGDRDNLGIQARRYKWLSPSVSGDKPSFQTPLNPWIQIVSCIIYQL